MQKAKAGIAQGEALLAKLAEMASPMPTIGKQQAGSLFQKLEDVTYLACDRHLNVLDPEMVVIGGGVSNLDDLLFDPVRRVVKENLGTSPLGDVPIVKAELGADVGVLGAAMLVVAQN